MALPLLAKLGALGLGLWAVTKKSPAGPSSPSSPGAVPSPTSMPIPQRMALVLSSGDPAAIRFEAGRLRQEGYPAQASELEREATKLEQAAHPAAAPAPVVKPPAVGPLPTGAITSAGVPQKPVAAPLSPAVVVAPPITVQTPAGPVQAPAVTIQTPVGPVSVPAIPVPTVATPPVVVAPPVQVQTPMGPVMVQQPPPLPVLAQGELLTRTNPGQTYSEKTKQWQAWLAALSLMQPSDVIGKFGPTTETATKNFQMLANAWLTLQGKPKLTVDGKVGPQTISVAKLAHPPIGTGATASYFGSLDMSAFREPPVPASPLPGVLPPMAPKSIEPRAALASRVAHNLTLTEPGQEDRQLVQLFQMQEGLKSSGLYNGSTAMALAINYGIVPPKPRYWTGTGTTKAKKNYAAKMRELGKRDPQRQEEWEQAASNL